MQMQKVRVGANQHGMRKTMNPSLSRAITTIFFVLLLVVHISAYLSLIGRLAYCRRASESSNVNDATSRERVRRFGIWWPRPSHPSQVSLG